MQRILFVNHARHRCGVQQFGVITHEALTKYGSGRYSYVYVEAESPEDFWHQANQDGYDGFLINYHDQTVPWVNQESVNAMSERGKVFLITGHDHYCSFDNAAAFIVPDPTALEFGRVKKVGRCIVKPEGEVEPLGYEEPVIGFFGFGFRTKGVRGLVDVVNGQFNKAVIRLHIPANDFADPHGHAARNIAQEAMVHVKEGISVEYSYEFKPRNEMCLWLAQNDINCFFYEEQKGRGISSVIDFALGAGKPIAITRSDMFRHIYNERRILIEENGLAEILTREEDVLKPFRELWTPQNLARDYERILDEVYISQG